MAARAPGDGPSGPSSASSPRRTSSASQPARSMRSCAHRASTASARARSAGCALSSTAASRRSASGASTSTALLRAEEDVLAYTAVPREHWSKVWSTNPSNGSTASSRGAPTWSESRGPRPPRRRAPRRAARRVADGGPPLPARGLAHAAPRRRPQPDARRVAQGGCCRLREGRALEVELHHLTGHGLARVENVERRGQLGKTPQRQRA